MSRICRHSFLKSDLVVLQLIDDRNLVNDKTCVNELRKFPRAFIEYENLFLDNRLQSAILFYSFLFSPSSSNAAAASCTVDYFHLNFVANRKLMVSNCSIVAVKAFRDKSLLYFFSF